MDNLTKKWVLLLGNIMIIENFHDASKWLEGKTYRATCDAILLIDKIHSEHKPEENKYHRKLRRNLKKPNRFQENGFKNTWP